MSQMERIGRRVKEELEAWVSGEPPEDSIVWVNAPDMKIPDWLQGRGFGGSGEVLSIIVSDPAKDEGFQTMRVEPYDVLVHFGEHDIRNIGSIYSLVDEPDQSAAFKVSLN